MKTDTCVTYDVLRQIAFSMGASLFGVADLDRIREDTDLLNPCYDAYSRGISVGVTLDEAALAGIVDGPTPEYCREYIRVNAVLDSIARALAEAIERIGASAVRIPASEVVDWERLRGHLPHKLIGRYAGHGWIGRNILLVHPHFGARVRYVTVLTDLPLEPDSPTERSCGTCMRCVAVCPAGAPKEDPKRFDLRACFNKLAEFNERLDEPHFICGLCVSACRGNKTGEKGGAT
ncbi:MAG: epoxyqueuosine reductase [Candidatus Abyssobacteria bacterium SURF_17]|jgi:epoxyqueuosine reductase QueG|uniref:Epoxyqueuosine reductase n=1 Tax=Candidatus Abyssobacteria bacterium SURF_17 TaxID=2093361 RepID=A0A419ENG3_9BACT|nr:MAG: epoxyqueuosine reductase [Candidatus Abyssubacteria bacterium SURF_17]